jgi:hypothetical protein
MAMVVAAAINQITALDSDMLSGTHQGIEEEAGAGADAADPRVSGKTSRVTQASAAIPASARNAAL